MKSLFFILKYIYKHPLNKNRKLKAIFNFFKWQFISFFLKRGQIVKWIDDTKFIVRKGDTGLTGNLYCGLMDFRDMGFLLHYLRETDTFYDIGANLGIYTLISSSIKKCISYTFEPIPNTYNRLIEQIKINKIQKKVFLNNCGVGKKSENLKFTYFFDSGNKVSIDSSDDVITRPVISLDDSFNPKSNTVVKIDVEGYEKFVLEGGSKFFSNNNVKVLIIELNDLSDDYGYSINEIHQIILSHGFMQVKYDPIKRNLYHLKNIRENEDVNVIYIKNFSDTLKRCKKSKKVVIHTVDDLSI